MNDRTLTPELARVAALARVRRAKDQWTKAAVSALHGHANAEDVVTSALAELSAARAALADLDAPNRAFDES